MAPTPDTAAPKLRDVNETVPIPAYLRAMLERKSYVWQVAVSELRARQVTTVLGNLWHLLNPALSIGTYYLIFGVVLGTDRGVDHFFAFLTIGLFTYQLTQRSIVRGANAIVTNQALIRAVRFPRAVLPLTSTLVEALIMIPSFAVAYAIALASGVPPSLRWFALPGVLAIQCIFNLGLSLFTARLTTHLQDTTQILPFLFRLLLYGSGVLFNVDAYIGDRGPAVRALFTLNPLYGYVSMARWCVLGDPIRGWLVVSAGAWTAAALFIGFFWFRAGELRYARG